MSLVHASCVAVAGAGVLLRGDSGAGKSDLALRLIDGGGTLVADDQTQIRRDGDRVIASAPDQLSGLLEIRGLGILRMPAHGPVPLRLVVNLTSDSAVERLPEISFAEIEGVAVSAATETMIETFRW